MADPSPPAETGWGAGAVVLGAHGGSGATTLTHLLPAPTYDLGPAVDTQGHARTVTTYGRPLILTARYNVPGVVAASRAINGLREQNLSVECLVVVADGAGPDPREAKVRLRMLEGHTGAILRLSFVPALRGMPEPPAPGDLPRRVSNEISAIREHILNVPVSKKDTIQA